MKLLLAFKSFLPRRLIVEIGSENWFAAGCPIRQRELVRCRLPNSVATTISLQAASSAAKIVSLPAANAAAKTISLLAPQFRQRITISLQPTQLRQRIASSLQNTPLGSELLIRCRRHSFGSEPQFAAKHTIRQRMLIRCSRHSFGCESQFRCTTHNSAANANSLQKTQFRQQITNSLQTT